MLYDVAYSMDQIGEACRKARDLVKGQFACPGDPGFTADACRSLKAQMPTLPIECPSEGIPTWAIVGAAAAALYVIAK